MNSQSAYSLIPFSLEIALWGAQQARGVLPLSDYEIFLTRRLARFFDPDPNILAIKANNLVQRLCSDAEQYNLGYNLQDITAVTCIKGMPQAFAVKVCEELEKIPGRETTCRVVACDTTLEYDPELLPSPDDTVLICCNEFRPSEQRWLIKQSIRRIRECGAAVIPCLFIGGGRVRNEHLDEISEKLPLSGSTTLKRTMFVWGWGVVTLFALSSSVSQDIAAYRQTLAPK